MATTAIDRINVRAADAKAKSKRQSDKSGEVIQLPLWGNDKRGIPNEVVRSALFTVRNRRTKRQDFKDHPILVVGGGTITYRGEELRTDDEDVWLQLMHLAREQPLGEWVEFAAYSMLKELKWGRTGRDYERLRRCLSRMQATTLMVTSRRLKKGGVTVSLVRRFEWRDEDNEPLSRWRVWIEPEMRELYGDCHYTQVEWEQRQQLSPMGKRMYDYFASHRQPYPIKVATLKGMFASTVKTLFHFRPSLRRALQEIYDAGLLEKWWIDDNDLVHVVRAKRPTELS